MLLHPFVFSIRWRRRRAIGGQQMGSGAQNCPQTSIGSRVIFDRFSIGPLIAPLSKIAPLIN